MRALVPAESLVYLETNDLAAALRPIVDNPLFERAAKTKPDLSALRGVQLAVAVTGFETSEEKLTDEHSIGRIRPRFVAIADTHAWNFQGVRFAEQMLGSFVADIYQSEPKLEKADKHGGKYFTWTADDGRKAFALVIDSIIYFGNDESAIEKCLAVRRGEADAMAKSDNAPAATGSLASGYVSTDGVAQIANVAALRFAADMGDETDLQSAIAGIVPQLIRNSLTDVTWTSAISEKGIVDSYKVGVSPEVGPVFTETFAPSGINDNGLFSFVPAEAPQVTLYNLEKPNVAWRGLLLTSRAMSGALAGAAIGEFSNSLLEPYGIKDAELFLSGVASNIVTLKADAEGDRPAMIAPVAINENVRRSLYEALRPDAKASKDFGVEVLRAADDDLAAAFVGSTVITGNGDAVFACLTARSQQKTIANSPAVMNLFVPDATSVTVSTESGMALTIAELFSEIKTDIRPQELNDAGVTVTETRFTRTSIERRTVSDFGMIGWIIAQISAN